MKKDGVIKYALLVMALTSCDPSYQTDKRAYNSAREVVCADHYEYIRIGVHGYVPRFDKQGHPRRCHGVEQ